MQEIAKNGKKNAGKVEKGEQYKYNPGKARRTKREEVIAN